MRTPVVLEEVVQRDAPDLRQLQVAARLGLGTREFDEALQKAYEVEFGVEGDGGNVVARKLEDHDIKSLYVNDGDVVGVFGKSLWREEERKNKNIDYGSNGVDDEIVHVSIGVWDESLHKQLVDAFD